MTANNTGCTVQLDDFRAKKVNRVPLRAAKQSKPAPKEIKLAIPGPDGKTLGQRLAEAMAWHSRAIARDYAAQDLFRDVNRLLGAPVESPRISQQSISKILVPNSTVTTSKNSVYFAQVLGVDHVWLSSGIGSKTGKRKNEEFSD